MSGNKAILITIAVIALAFANSVRPLDYLAVALVLVVVCARVWSWLSVRGIEVSRKLPPNRSQVGQLLEEQVGLSVRTPFPRPWLELRDHSTLPDHRFDLVVGMDVAGAATWSIQSRCRRRGEYTVGPLTVLGSDPFGFFTTSREVPSRQRIIVYPATPDISALDLPTFVLPGGTQRQPGAHQITPHASGVREYQAGDSRNRIHWLSTARARRLMVKEFDLDPLSDIWLFLDLYQKSQRGHGDESTEEYAVTATASLARHLLDQGRAVGVAAIGSYRCLITPDRGSRQLIRILENLAVLRATGDVPMHELIAAEEARCSRRSTAIAITPSPDHRWAAGLRALGLRGVTTAAVIVDRSTFNDSNNSEFDGGIGKPLPLAEHSSLGGPSPGAILTAAGIATYTLRRGDRFEDVLRGAGRGYSDAVLQT